MNNLLDFMIFKTTSMYKRTFLFVFTFLSLVCTLPLANGQYTLDQALKEASLQSTAYKLQALNTQEYDIQRSILAKRKLPQISFLAQATYQSETTGLNLSFPGVDIQRLSKDQYKAQIEATQLIYDGGQTALMQSLKKLNADSENQKSLIDIEGLKDQTLLLYFGVLEAVKRKEILLLSQEDISQLQKKIEAGVTFGTVLKKELQQLLVEKANLQQQMDELDLMAQMLKAKLAIITNNATVTQLSFNSPQATLLNPNFDQNKAEFKLLAMQQMQSELQYKLEKLNQIPKLAAFTQIGYGKPGLNFLVNEFQPYYIVGLRLQWNISSFYNTKNNLAQYQLQQDKTALRREGIQQQLDLKAMTIETEIEKLNTLLKTDDEVIELRKKIKDTAFIQVENGTLTSSDYVIKLNDYQEALYKKELHQLLLVKNQYQNNLLKGGE